MMRRLFSGAVLFFPFKIFTSRADLKVVFYDSKIDAGVETAGSLCFYSSRPDQSKEKILAVHRGRRQHGAVHSLFEPGRHISLNAAQLRMGFTLVGQPLGGAIAESEHADEFFAGGEFKMLFCLSLAEGQRNPAGVEAEDLGFQSYALAVISDFFLETGIFFSRPERCNFLHC